MAGTIGRSGPAIEHDPGPSQHGICPAEDQVIEELVPTSVVAVDTFVDSPGATLFPDEEAVVTRAVDQRRQEFTSARLCARTALARLGVPAVPILPGERGAPVWPDGIVGSMTHCPGYRAAAVARAADMRTIGVDAELNEPLPAGVLDLISLPEEREDLSRMHLQRSDVCCDRLLFSAKESVYKAWFPLTLRWLDFSDARVTFDLLDGTFSARLLPPCAPLARVRGRWLVDAGLIMTTVAVPARSVGVRA
jgi:4'-phosphopantetheinyl transferase EntD